MTSDDSTISMEGRPSGRPATPRFIGETGGRAKRTSPRRPPKGVVNPPSARPLEMESGMPRFVGEGRRTDGAA